LADLFARLQAALANRYTIERELGRGGMATVYLAQDLKHHRKVAIKVLRPELAAALGPERFLREIDTAARLNHPHILPLHDSGQADGFLYYVMPYIEGESLRDRLEREGPLPLEDALRITRDVTSALSYAHGHDVVHRDIKPENILLSGGEAVVADFGIARAITAAAAGTLTETGIAIGTPGYMSPEQATESERLDGRSDIYSLGCMLYEMLAGEPPYTGANARSVIAKQLTDPVPSVRRLRDTIPPAIDGAVSKALAKAPADRFVSAAQFADALTASAAPSVRPWFSRRRILLAGAITTATAALVVTVLQWRAGAGPALDANLIAVAPFAVLDPKLDLWREGMVDLLSHQLDGAGALRTVPPSVVLHRWSGTPDAASATEMARRTGARLTVFGTLMGSGADSVQLTATLFDADARKPVGEIELRGSATRMDRLVDSVTVRLLSELARTRPVTAVRRAALGSSSLPALKAFLEGERFYRQGQTDSAIASYQRSVELDSSFCLGWRRLGQVTEWSTLSGDSLARVYLLRAGRLNHGLPPRESLLVASESLFEALYQDPPEPVWWERRNRLFTTLEGAARLYPEDPEVWYELGEARAHWPLGGRNITEHALEAFGRAIALDSSFMPGYFHTAQLALWQAGPAEARRYLAAYLAHAGSLVRRDPEASGVELSYRLLVSDASREQREQWLAAASPYELLSALNILPAWRDSAETYVQLARAFAARVPTSNAEWEDSSSKQFFLALALAQRGHLREAYAVGGPALLFALAPYLRLVDASKDSTGALFSPLLSARSHSHSLSWASFFAVYVGADWWAARRDTVSLRSLQRRMDQIVQASKGRFRVERHALYSAALAHAYLALARGDTAAALAGFLALPDSVCTFPSCILDRLTTVHLLLAAGRLNDAVAAMDRPLPGAFYWSSGDGLWHLERARVAERVGRRADAVREYAYVADAWRSADEELQPYVREARAALQRLSAEPRR